MSFIILLSQLIFLIIIVLGYFVFKKIKNKKHELLLEPAYLSKHIEKLQDNYSKEIFYISDINTRLEYSRKFIDKISLPYHLHNFIEEIIHYPYYYENGRMLMNCDIINKEWSSAYVGKGFVSNTKVKDIGELPHVFNNYVLNEDDDIFKFCFREYSTFYQLFVLPKQFSTNWYVPIIVAQASDFQIKHAYMVLNNYFYKDITDNYYAHELLCFSGGLWLVELMRIMSGVKTERTLP